MRAYLKQYQVQALLPIAYDMVIADLQRERREIDIKIALIEDERAKRKS